MTKTQNNTKTDELTKMQTETINLSEEDKILGSSETKITKTYFDYENKNVLYSVTNLKTNRTVTVTGKNIETFIGCKNISAREKLKSGEKIVETLDGNKKPAYKIEKL